MDESAVKAGAPRKMTAGTAVRVGAVYGMGQVVTTAGTGLASGLLPDAALDMLIWWVLNIAWACAAAHHATGPRYRRTPPRKEGRGRFAEALVRGLWPGTLALLLTALVIVQVGVVLPRHSPWNWAQLALWYPVCGAVTARMAYRIHHRAPAKSAAKPAAKGTAKTAAVVPNARAPQADSGGQARAVAARVPAAYEKALAAQQRALEAEDRARAAEERARAAERHARDAEAREQSRQSAITEFGALLAAHPFVPGAPGVTYRELADHTMALDAYERAKHAPAQDVERILAEGRAALARLDAGRPPAAPGTPCFFDERHGPAAVSVRWAPPGGTPRMIAVCRADAVRLADGELPGGR